MLQDRRIGFIGSGNMAEALISGLVVSGAAVPGHIICSDIFPETRTRIHDTYGVLTTASNMEVCETSELIIYAVKPQILGAVLEETASILDKSRLVISIAAGVPLAAIAASLKRELRLVRAMPNICAFVKESATAVSPGAFVQDGDVELARAVFDSVGRTVCIQEKGMDAFTGLGGSGPAYIFTIVDALADAGVKMGLSRADARFVATQTVLGSARLLLESGEHPGQLKDKVTSPGGTTIAGIHTLEQCGIRPALMNAVESATRRSAELGEMVVKDFGEPEN